VPCSSFEQNSSYFGSTPELSHSLCSFSDFKIDNKRFFQNIQLPSRRTVGLSQVVSKRIAKKQQMQWTQRGAQLLLQVRTRVLNEDGRMYSAVGISISVNNNQ
jgi:hypothetical protein